MKSLLDTKQNAHYVRFRCGEFVRIGHQFFHVVVSFHVDMKYAEQGLRKMIAYFLSAVIMTFLTNQNLCACAHKPGRLSNAKSEMVLIHETLMQRIRLARA